MVRSTRFWLVAFVVLGVVSYGVSVLFGVPGSNNDPLLAVQVEFREQAADVGLDGGLTEEEPARDLGVAAHVPST
jgi:hypothetical protein